MNACKEEGVEHLIYCGSISSFYDFDGADVNNGTEETVPYPKSCDKIYEYAETKRKAMDIVLKENGCILYNGILYLRQFIENSICTHYLNLILRLFSCLQK